MAADLVQRLRECPAEDRARVVAIKCAQIGTNEVVRGLIGVVEGGDHTPEVWRREPWYSLHKKCVQSEKWEYQLSDQLAAIEALGETKSQRALDYLRDLLDGGIAYIGGGKSDEGYRIGSEFYSSRVWATYALRKAVGPLRERLAYTFSAAGQTFSVDEDVILALPECQVIYRAIERLEKTLKTA